MMFSAQVEGGVTQIVHSDVTNELHQDEKCGQHKGSSVSHLAFSSDSYPSELWAFICTVINPTVFAANGRWGDSGHT